MRAGIAFVDTQLRAGKSPGPGPGPELPIVPGNAVGGTVVALGEGVGEELMGNPVRCDHRGLRRLRGACRRCCGHADRGPIGARPREGGVASCRWTDRVPLAITLFGKVVVGVTQFKGGRTWICS